MALYGDPSNSGQARILQHVRENPGLCIQEIADRMGHTRTAAVHHVRRLVSQGRILTVRKGRRVLHFLPEEVKPRQRAFLGLMRVDTVRRIIANLQESPTISWRQLARRCDVAPHTIRWHLKRLNQEGLIEIRTHNDADGHFVVVHPEVQAVAATSAPATPSPTPPVPDDHAAPGGDLAQLPPF